MLVISGMIDIVIGRETGIVIGGMMESVTDHEKDVQTVHGKDAMGPRIIVRKIGDEAESAIFQIPLLMVLLTRTQGTWRPVERDRQARCLLTTTTSRTARALLIITGRQANPQPE